jgi:hypothetical protein
VVFTDSDGEEVAVVDRERIFNDDGTFAELADKLDVDVETVENEIPVPDGGDESPLDELKSTTSEPADGKPASHPASVVDWTAVPYVDDDTARNLSAAGYTTLESIREASDDELTTVDGVGPAIVSNLREYSRDG